MNNQNPTQIKLDDRVKSLDGKTVDLDIVRISNGQTDYISGVGVLSLVPDPDDPAYVQVRSINRNNGRTVLLNIADMISLCSHPNPGRADYKCKASYQA